MPQHGTLRCPELPEDPDYKARAQMDPYKLGAADVFKVKPSEVTDLQRQAFKVAFMETIWTHLFGEERRTFVADLEHASVVIETGINEGLSEAEICENVIMDLGERMRSEDGASSEASRIETISVWWLPIALFIVGAALLLLLRA